MNREKLSETNPEKAKALRAQRDAYVHRLFTMMLEFLFVFGVPAFLAFYFGSRLDGETGKTWTILLSVFAFIFSWVMVIIRVRSITKHLGKLDQAIKDLEKNV